MCFCYFHNMQEIPLAFGATLWFNISDALLCSAGGAAGWVGENKKNRPIYLFLARNLGLSVCFKNNHRLTECLNVLSLLVFALNNIL